MAAATAKGTGYFSNAGGSSNNANNNNSSSNSNNALIKEHIEASAQESVTFGVMAILETSKIPSNSILVSIARERRWFVEYTRPGEDLHLDIDTKGKDRSFADSLPAELYMTHAYRAYLRLFSGSGGGGGGSNSNHSSSSNSILLRSRETIIAQVSVLDFPSLVEQQGILSGVDYVSLSRQKNFQGRFKLKFKGSNYQRKGSGFFCLRISIWHINPDSVNAAQAEHESVSSGAIRLLSMLSPPFKVFSKIKHKKRIGGSASNSRSSSGWPSASATSKGKRSSKSKKRSRKGFDDDDDEDDDDDDDDNYNGEMVNEDSIPIMDEDASAGFDDSNAFASEDGNSFSFDSNAKRKR